MPTVRNRSLRAPSAPAPARHESLEADRVDFGRRDQTALDHGDALLDLQLVESHPPVDVEGEQDDRPEDDENGHDGEHDA